jgi:4-hydroxythreonine-4-phosphate dehydrogenase
MAMTGPLAITMGDPAGIGPEIIAKAFRDAPAELAGCLVAGDVATLRRAAHLIAGDGALALPVVQLTGVTGWQSVPPRCIPVLQTCVLPSLAAFGQISAAAGKAGADSIVWAARAALAGDVAAMVTAPIHKEALALAGAEFTRFPGHTELLQAEAASLTGKALADLPVRMMLANEELKTVLVSIHLSLRDALDAVTFDNVLQTLQIAHSCVRGVAGAAPRIAVAGLNPHAGEGGRFGSEEIDTIAPAIAAARTQGLNVSGPFAPDTVFMRARAPAGQAGEFDVVVAMYHDQGLIPVKYLGVEQGVNVTLGLPLVRTSPDHGTAFDIAGTGKADASSLIAAVRMARSLAA